jgi:hypothetical protein
MLAECCGESVNTWESIICKISSTLRNAPRKSGGAATGKIKNINKNGNNQDERKHFLSMEDISRLTSIQISLLQINVMTTRWGSHKISVVIKISATAI